MYVEITKEVFDLIRHHASASTIEGSNGAIKEYYYPCADTQLVVTYNRNGTEPQYYIRDINA